MDEVYERVARAFALRVNAAFTSEETLEQLFHTYFKGLTYQRTDHWSNVLRLELAKIWKEVGPAVKTQPVQHDVDEILWCLKDLLDFNLFSQVLLNLQSWVGFGYSIPDAKKDIEELEKKYEGKKLTPFAPKAKFARGHITEEEQIYNLDLSSMKALKIIGGFTPMNSFRVSPKGSTPALADSRDLSRLGWGADKYMRVLNDLKTYYVTWDVGDTPLLIEDTEAPSTFSAKGIDYPFVSKSGGETLNDVLFSRLIATYFYSKCRPQLVLPRMNSVLIVATQASNVDLAFREISTAGVPHGDRHGDRWTVLEFHEGSRTYAATVDDQS